MQYRKLQTEDFDSYNKLREMSLETAPEAFLSTNEEERGIRKKRFYSTIQNEFNFILGAFDGNELIGIVSFVREIRKKIIHKGGIFGMFVKPEYQGAGNGSKLLELALDKAFKTEGIKQINLSVITSNERAVKLYEKAGFVSYGLEKDALCINGKFFDELLMVNFKK